MGDAGPAASRKTRQDESTGGGSAPGRRGRRRLSVDQRREELIAAALELLSNDSPENVSIDDVAHAAGASRALVYHYFGGKNELCIAALRSAAKQLTDSVEPPLDGRPLDRLATGLRLYFDFVERHAAGFSALLRGGHAASSSDVGELVDNVREFMIERLFGEFGTADPGAVLRITLRSWIGCVETAGLDWLERRDLPREQLERLLVDQLVMLLQVAAQHDHQVRTLFGQLAAEQLG